MDDTGREDSYYHPGGIPITPQARRLGYEFPVWVSDSVWRSTCSAAGTASKHSTNTDKRIYELLQYCYDGMTKKLAVTDDFLTYYFKVWYWSRFRTKSKKKKRALLAARLFLDPSTNGPWLYIFSPSVDTIDILRKGQPDEIPDTSDSSSPSPNPDGSDSES